MGTTAHDPIFEIQGQVFLPVDTGFGKFYRGIDAVDGISQMHEKEIKTIDADVQEGTASQFRSDYALYMVDVIGKVTGHHRNVADHMLSQKFVDQKLAVYNS